MAETVNSSWWEIRTYVNEWVVRVTVESQTLKMVQKNVMYVAIG